nr:hypothetical protein [Micromonospora sp. DSM 115978]
MFAGTVTPWLLARSGGARGRPFGRAGAPWRFWDAPVPAVLVASGVTLAVHVTLLVDQRVGVPAQLAGGSSGGGYLGLLATAGALLAAGCLLRLRAEGRFRSWPAALAVTVFTGHLGALVFTGFRSAAPLLCLALFLTAAGSKPAGRPEPAG